MQINSQLFRLTVDGYLFLLIVLIAIFEGALIKWFGFPSSVLLVFRDALGLLLIYRAIQFRVLSRIDGFVNAACIWSFLIVCYGLIQSIFNQSPPVLFIIGLRFNILYLWMAISAACLLADDDFEKIAKLFLYICIFLAPLVILQSYLPTDHVLNTQPATEIENIFTSSGGYVRTTGTFTFTLGFTCLLTLLIPFVLTNTWGGADLIKSKWQALIALLSIILMTAVSGSRAAIAWLLIIFLLGIFSDLFILKKITKRNFVAIFLLIVGGLLALFFLDGQINAMQDRFVEANDSEVLSERIWTIFFGEPHVMNAFSFIGHGLGAGTNAASVIMDGVRDFALAESEPGRNLLELGFLGFVYIFIKWLVSIYFVLRSIIFMKQTNNPLPLLLWLSTAYAFLTWAVSGQLSANVIAYILLTFSLASLRRADAVNNQSFSQ